MAPSYSPATPVILPRKRRRCRDVRRPRPAARRQRLDLVILALKLVILVLVHGGGNGFSLHAESRETTRLYASSLDHVVAEVPKAPG